MATKVITTLLNLILALLAQLQTLSSNKRLYLGTMCVPSYANISMDHFEKKYMYPFFQGTSLIYLRCNDDIFFIWTGIQEQLKNCLNDLTQKHNSIKLEYKISQTSITFLDKEVFIQNNKLFTKIYRKSTDCQNFYFIQPSAQNQTICTTLNDFNQYCEELKQRFINKGYKPEIVDKNTKTVKKWTKKIFF